MKSKKCKEKMLLLKWIAIIWGFSAWPTKHSPLDLESKTFLSGYIPVAGARVRLMSAALFQLFFE